MLPLGDKSKGLHPHPLHLPPTSFNPFSWLPSLPQQVPNTALRLLVPVLLGPSCDSPGGLAGQGGLGDDDTSPALTSSTRSGPGEPLQGVNWPRGRTHSADTLGDPQVCAFLAAAVQEQVPGCKGHLLLGEGKGHAPDRRGEAKENQDGASVWEPTPP